MKIILAVILLLTGAPAVASPPSDQRPSSGVDGASVLAASATWYCKPYRSRCTRGYPWYLHGAAAGSTLRAGAWRGRVVRVCRADRVTQCVYARLIDACVCAGIDLYASAFDDLAPLWVGRLRVTVR